MDGNTMGKAVFSNETNYTGSHTPCPYDYCVENTLYRTVTGTLLFVIVWPFIVQDMKFFPIGRPTAALLGALLMVVFNIVPQDQVYLVLGQRGNLQAICLLVGMMMLSHYYNREGLLDMMALWIFKKEKQFKYVLWKACVLSAVMSAILTNDASCVVLTPLLLNEHRKQKRSQQEIAPLLLGIATSANIGSASTLFGNPQNVFIASQTGLSLLIFFVTSLPAAIVGTAINTGLLYLMYYKVLVIPNDSDCGTDSVAAVPTNQTCVSAVSNGLITPPTTSMSTENNSELPSSCSPPLQSDSAASSNQCCAEHTRLWQNHHNCPNTDSSGNTAGGGGHYWETSLSTTDVCYGATNMRELNSKRANESMIGAWGNKIARKRERKKSSSVATTGGIKSIYVRPFRDKLFIFWLGLVTVLLIILLAIPPLDSVTFNLGLVPIGAAVLTMLADTLIHCGSRDSKGAMNNVDWTIILMFFGLFVWLVGFENTSLPRRAFKTMNHYMNLSSVPGVLLFTLFVVLGSNILSNVPLVILILNELETFECGVRDCSQLTGILLAWVSTIAGNFTLIGSVANLIVAEKAKNCANYNITFWEYLKFGLPSTILVLFTGLPIVYYAGKYASISIL